MPQFLGVFLMDQFDNRLGCSVLGRVAFGRLWFKVVFHCLAVGTHILNTWLSWPEAMSFYEGLGFTPTAATVSLSLILRG